MRMGRERKNHGMDEKICCFSGHRKLSDENTLKALLDRVIYLLSRHGVSRFRCGGALGFDTLAAESVIERRKQDSSVQLDMILPCRSQERFWTEQQQASYQAILKQADRIHYVSEHYDAECMYRRNRCLVDGSNLCVCYLNQTGGGTQYTVNYARKKGILILNLAEWIKNTK